MALQVCVGDEPLALGLGREMGMKRRQPRCDGARITFSHARPTGILYKMRDARGLRRARDLLLCLTYVFESPVSVTAGELLGVAVVGYGFTPLGPCSVHTSRSTATESTGVRSEQSSRRVAVTCARERNERGAAGDTGLARSASRLRI